MSSTRFCKIVNPGMVSGSGSLVSGKIVSGRVILPCLSCRVDGEFEGETGERKTKEDSHW